MGIADSVLTAVIAETARYPGIVLARSGCGSENWRGSIQTHCAFALTRLLRTPSLRPWCWKFSSAVDAIGVPVDTSSQ